MIEEKQTKDDTWANCDPNVDYYSRGIAAEGPTLCVALAPGPRGVTPGRHSAGIDKGAGSHFGKEAPTVTA